MRGFGAQALQASQCKIHGVVVLFRLVLLVLSLASFTTSVLAQVVPHRHLDLAAGFTNYVHESWDAVQGLRQSTISDITQTPDGSIWVGLQTGAARYDGISFRMYDRSTDSVFESDWVGKLGVTRDSTLWICTQYAGLYSVHSGVFTSHAISGGSPGWLPRVFLQASDGSLWLSIPSVGLWHGNGNTWEKVKGPRSLTNVWAAIEDDDGSLWFGLEGAIAHLSKGVWRFYESTDGVPGTAILALQRLDRKGILIGTAWNGMYVFHDGRVTPLPSAEDLRSESIQTMCRDKEGTVWIGTTRRGLYAYSGLQLRPCFRPDLTSPLVINALYCDQEGSLWIGTAGEGLHRMRKGPVRFVALGDNETSGYVWSVYPRRNGLWIGTGGAGVQILDGSRLSRPSLHRRLDRSYVYAFAEGNDGDLWIGANSGLFRVERSLAREITSPSGESYNDVTCVLRDSRGRVWFSHLQHVSYDSSGRITDVGPSVGFNPDGIITRLLEDRSGKLWVATDRNGVAVRDHGTFAYYSAGSGLTSKTVLSLFEDSQGGIWVGTQGGGICRFKDGRWGACTKRDGLPDNTIGSIVRGDDGVVWLATDEGLFGVKEQDLIDVAERRNPGVEGIIVGMKDGLTTLEFSCGVQNPAARMADGTIWYGTPRGILGFSPNVKTQETRNLHVSISGIVVNGREHETSDNAVLGPGVRILEFDFVALNLNVPSETRYRYRLDGFDDEWVDAGEGRKAVYTNLAPGTYAFHVSAARKNGPWSDHASSFDFRLVPFFWQTVYFAIAVGALLLLLAWVIYRWQLGRLSRRERELESRVAERTEELVSQQIMLSGAEERYRTLVNNLGEGIAVTDVNDQFTFANAAADRIFECRSGTLVGKSLFDFLDKGGRAVVKQETERRLAGKSSVYEHDVILPGNARKTILITATPQLDEKGTIIGTFAILHDMTERKISERALAASVAEKELLLKEIHHRVKNNLQVVSSLLSIQASNVTSPEIRGLFLESQNRVRAMSIVHEQLYRSRDLSSIPFAEYVNRLAEQVIRSYPAVRVRLLIHPSDIFLGIDVAIPCGLIVNELVSNAMKHAFVGRETGQIEIWINCVGQTTAEIIIVDDGIGLRSEVDFRRMSTMGMTIINGFVDQIHGSITLDASKGSKFVITFPIA